MPEKKSRTEYKVFFKIPVGEILKDWLEKGNLTEEEIAEKIKVTELTVHSNVPSISRKREKDSSEV